MMKIVAAYMLLVTGGNPRPSALDIQQLFAAVDIQCDLSLVASFVEAVQERSAEELVSMGMVQLCTLFDSSVVHPEKLLAQLNPKAFVTSACYRIPESLYEKLFQEEYKSRLSNVFSSKSTLYADLNGCKVVGEFGRPMDFILQMKDLYDTGTDYDIVVRLANSNVAFKAHKEVLINRCEFFKAMFANKWRDACGTEVTIEKEDLTDDTFRSILSYIYLDDIEPGQALQILQHSNYFFSGKTDHLYHLCLYELANNGLSIENCMDAYSYVKSNNWKEYVEMIEWYILVNRNAITNKKVIAQHIASLIIDRVETECEKFVPVATYYDSDDMCCEKPVLYLYPESDQEISVYLESSWDEKIVVSYPKLQEQHNLACWKVHASSNGNITDLKCNKQYSYLFWENTLSPNCHVSEALQSANLDVACIHQSELEEYLGSVVAALGLSCTEKNDFMVYWMPRLLPHRYSVIRFSTLPASDCFISRMHITTEPSLQLHIRVMMLFKAISAQEATTVYSSKLNTIPATIRANNTTQETEIGHKYCRDIEDPINTFELNEKSLRHAVWNGVVFVSCKSQILQRADCSFTIVNTNLMNYLFQQLPFDTIIHVLQFYISAQVASEFCNKEFDVDKDDDHDWFFVTRHFRYINALGTTLSKPLLSCIQPSVLSFHRIVWSDKNAMYSRELYEEYNTKNKTEKVVGRDLILFSTPERNAILQRANRMQKHAFRWLQNMYFAKRPILSDHFFQRVKTLDLSNLPPRFLLNEADFMKRRFENYEQFSEFVEQNIIRDQPLFNIVTKCPQVENLLLVGVHLFLFLDHGNSHLKGIQNIAQNNPDWITSSSDALRKCLLACHILEQIKGYCKNFKFLDVICKSSMQKFAWLDYLGITIMNNQIPMYGLSFRQRMKGLLEASVMNNYITHLGSKCAAMKRHVAGYTMLNARVINEEYSRCNRHLRNYKGRIFYTLARHLQTIGKELDNRNFHGWSLYADMNRLGMWSEVSDGSLVNFQNDIPLWYLVTPNAPQYETPLVNMDNLSILDTILASNYSTCNLELLIQRLSSGLKITRKTLDYLNIRRAFEDILDVIFSADSALTELLRDAMLTDSQLDSQTLLRRRHQCHKIRDRTLASYCITVKLRESVETAYVKYLTNHQLSNADLNRQVWRMFYDTSNTKYGYNILHHLITCRKSMDPTKFAQLFWYHVNKEASYQIDDRPTNQQKKLHLQTNRMGRTPIDDLILKDPSLHARVMNSYEESV